MPILYHIFEKWNQESIFRFAETAARNLSFFEQNLGFDHVQGLAAGAKISVETAGVLLPQGSGTLSFFSDEKRRDGYADQ